MNPVVAFNFVLSLAGVLMIWAAISDAVRYRIPNLASLSLLLLFPVYVALAPIPVPWEQHVIVFVVFLVLGYLVYVKNWAGAGDIKMLAVIGLWAGPSYALKFLFITSIAGGILALGVGTLSFFQHMKKRSQEPSQADQPVPFSKIPLPYGVAIALGGLCTLALLSHPTLIAAKV